MDHLIAPYGGTLCDLLVSNEEAQKLKKESVSFHSLDLLPRQVCDLELLINGGFSPLRGFMTREDYETVLDHLRLKDGMLWPMPITLDVSEDFARKLKKGDPVALRDQEGFLLSIMNVKDIWKVDKEREAIKVYGTSNDEHPGVNYLYHQIKDFYVGGELEGIQLPLHYDFKMLRQTPEEVRKLFNKLGWRRVVAFQTRNPLHRAHREMTLRAVMNEDANLFLHPVVGMTKPGDIDHYVRVRCYIEISKKYPPNIMTMSLLPLAMRMAGPREGLWHGIIRRNYGCTHFIVGRDHAGPGSDSSGNLFYGEYDAQNMFKEYQDEIGIKMIPFKKMVYVEDKAQYYPINEVPEGARTADISGTELRRRLAEGLEIPQWFSYSEVVQELRKSFPSKEKQGITIFFTGLSGAGKSTIANVLLVKLLEMGGRPITLLDGDIVRKNLSSELGFSKEHRDLNVRRIGYVASEITKNRGIAICAPIAPYKNTRNHNRELISRYGKYIEVYVATPLEECEKRDRKGLYAKARAGIIKGFTGINDPYEEPESPEIRIDTTDLSPDESAQEILLYLESNGYIK